MTLKLQILWLKLIYGLMTHKGVRIAVAVAFVLYGLAACDRFMMHATEGITFGMSVLCGCGIFMGLLGFCMLLLN